MNLFKTCKTSGKVLLDLFLFFRLPILASSASQHLLNHTVYVASSDSDSNSKKGRSTSTIPITLVLNQSEEGLLACELLYLHFCLIHRVHTRLSGVWQHKQILQSLNAQLFLNLLNSSDTDYRLQTTDYRLQTDRRYENTSAQQQHSNVLWRCQLSTVNCQLSTLQGNGKR